MKAYKFNPDSGSMEPLAGREMADPQRPSLASASWDGAKAGFRRMAYVAIAIAAGLVGLGIVLTALGVGEGQGWGASELVPVVLSIAVLCALGGLAVGAVAGLIGALVRRARPGTGQATAPPAADRRDSTPGTGRSAGDREAAARPTRRPGPVGITVLLAVAVAAGVVIYTIAMTSRRLADAIAAADRDDPYWRLDDLMAHREAIPDAENSARVVAEALSHLPENWPSAPAPPPGYPQPPPPAASKALDLLARWDDNTPLPDATAEAIRGELKTHAEAIRIARTVANYPRGRHELTLGPAVIDTLLPETQAARTAARLLQFDAAIRAQDGDLDGALDSCRAMLATGRSIGDEPFLISQLVRMAIGSVAMRSTRRVLAQGEPSDAALARLQALILDELNQPLLLTAMKGERASLSELIRRVGDGQISVAALGGGGQPARPGAFQVAISPLIRPWFDSQRALGLEWMNEAVAIERRPIAERPALWKAWDARVARVKGSGSAAFTATLPILLAPSVHAGGTAFYRYQGELGATAILLAAERHRRKTGAWPASIADIDRAILPAPPVDPFSGQSFLMERRDGKLFIYSIGPNRQDEHGAYDPRKWTSGAHDDIGAIGWDVKLRRQSTAGESEGGPASTPPP